MKKAISFMLCAVMLLSICACDGSGSASKKVMKYIDTKYEPQEFGYILSGDTAQGFEALLTISFYYSKDLTMYSAVENNTYIAVFDVSNEEVDLSQYTVTMGAMSAYGYQECGVDNKLFFTYSPQNTVLFAVHNGEDITADYN